MEDFLENLQNPQPNLLRVQATVGKQLLTTNCEWFGVRATPLTASRPLPSQLEAFTRIYLPRAPGPTPISYRRPERCRFVGVPAPYVLPGVEINELIPGNAHGVVSVSRAFQLLSALTTRAVNFGQPSWFWSAGFVLSPNQSPVGKQTDNHWSPVLFHGWGAF